MRLTIDMAGNEHDAVQAGDCGQNESCSQASISQPLCSSKSDTSGYENVVENLWTWISL